MVVISIHGDGHHQSQRRRLISGLEIEFSFAVIILLALALAGAFFLRNGYLPRPFFYDIDDDLTDWFNPAVYANNSGAYSRWLSIYPPFAFVFLKIFSLHSCYYTFDVTYARSCDWVGRVSLVLFYLLDVVLVWSAYRKEDPSTSIPRSIAVAFGIPMLFTLDRGNLIIPGFAFLVIGQAGIFKNTILRAFGTAISINFKPYLLVLLLPPFLKGKLRRLEYIIVAILVVYIVSYALFGHGSPIELYKDITQFKGSTDISYFETSYYASSYNNLVKLVKSQFPLLQILGSRPLDYAEMFLPIVTLVGRLAILSALIVAVLRPSVVPIYRLSALCICFMLSGESPGGYGQIFMLFFVFYEKWRGVFIPVAIVAAYILCVPYDVGIYRISHEVREAYLSNRTVGFDLGVSAGIFVRPGVIVLIELALGAETISSFFRSLKVSRAADRGSPTDRLILDE